VIATDLKAPEETANKIGPKAHALQLTHSFLAFPPNWWPPRSRTLRWSVRKAARGVEISLARVIVIDLRAENSRTRCAAFGVGVNSEAGCSQAAGVSTNSLAMANDFSMKSCE